MKTKQAKKTLTANNEGEVDDKELIQACENILLDVGDRSVVAEQDAAGGDSQQYTYNTDRFYL